MNVKRAAHADAVADHFRMPQCKVDSLVATEAASGNGDSRGPIFPANERQRFVQKIGFILQMAGDAHAWMHVLVVPAFGIDAVGAKDLQLTAIDLPAENTHHAAIFALIEATHGSGKDHERHATVAEDEHLHVAAEFVAVVLVVFAVHRARSILPETGGWKGMLLPQRLAAARWGTDLSQH